MLEEKKRYHSPLTSSKYMQWPQTEGSVASSVLHIKGVPLKNCLSEYGLCFAQSPQGDFTELGPNLFLGMPDLQSSEKSGRTTTGHLCSVSDDQDK